MRDVLKVTPSLIAKAVSHLKSGKSDPVFEFSSDCIKNAPTLFYEHLALVFRNFLIHGHISSVLMGSTLIPLLKDKLGDICASSNYRSIALSSLILKIFDLCKQLILHHGHFGLPGMGYQNLQLKIDLVGKNRQFLFLRELKRPSFPE